LAFSPDGKAVLTGSEDGTARLWSAASGKELIPPLRHRGPVYAVAFSPDGQAVLTGSQDQTARLWSVATGKELTPPLRHPGAVHAVAFSPDGRTVLTGSGYPDNSARLWSAATGKELTPPLRHQGPVRAVTFSPDGQVVLTGSGNLINNKTWGEARLWSVRTGQELIPPLRHQGPVNAVAFSPDRQALVTGSDDKTARLWQVPMAVKGDAHRIKLWTQVLTGMEMEDNGDLHVLSANTWQQRRQELGRMGVTPIPNEEGLLRWHRRQVVEAEVARQWFAAAWHLSRLINAAPTDGELWKARAQARAHLEEWKKAAFDLGKASQLAGVDPEAWQHLALLRLHLGDEKGYRQACVTLLKRWGSADDPQIFNTVARTCDLAPSAVADLKPVVQLAEKAAQKSPNDPNVLNTLGALLYRAGRYEEAVERLKEAITKSPMKKGSAWDWLFLAMAQQKLGQPEEARNCLAKAGEFMKAMGTSWDRRLELQVLHREAEALVNGKKR
jgi:Flp pilus assembly protein TadD